MTTLGDGALAVPEGADLLQFVPELRRDIARRDVDGECVVWSPVSADPVVLDPVATVMLAVVDGDASVAELATEVHEEIGIPLDRAQQQVAHVVRRFARAGLLTASISPTTAADSIAQRDVFVAPSTPCSENASRLGTETLLLTLGRHTVRIACDSRRASRALRSALSDHVHDGDADDVPLAFVLTAPQGLKRSHLLADRSGFVLSAARGLDAGLHALASHLTALLPPAHGTVRLRTRGVVAGDRVLLCLFPLLFAPTLAERDLATAGVRVIDRLALDIDVATGSVANPEIPWPALRDLAAAPTHAGAGGRRAVRAIVEATPPAGAVPPTPAELVEQIAACGVHGSPAELLDVAGRLVEAADVRSAPPEGNALVALLAELSAP